MTSEIKVVIEDRMGGGSSGGNTVNAGSSAGSRQSNTGQSSVSSSFFKSQGKSLEAFYKGQEKNIKQLADFQRKVSEQENIMVKHRAVISKAVDAAGVDALKKKLDGQTKLDDAQKKQGLGGLLRGLNAFMLSADPIKRGLGTALNKGSEASAKGAGMAEAAGAGLAEGAMAGGAMAALGAIAEILQTGLQPILKIISIFVKLIGFILLAFLMPFLKASMPYIKAALEFMIVLIKLAGKLSEFIVGFFSNIGAAIGGIIKGALNVAGGAAQAVGGVVGGAVQVAGDLGKWLWDNATSILKSAFNVLVPLGKWIWDSLTKLWTAEIDFMIGIGKWLWNLFTGIWSAELAALNGVGKFISDYLSNAIQGGLKILSSLGQIIVDLVTLNLNKLPGDVAKLGASIVSTAKSALSLIVNFFIDALNSIIKFINGITGMAGVKPMAMMGHVALAQGGVVSKPTMALIGESGPEAVVPLSQIGSMGGNITVNIHNPMLDSKSRIRELSKELQTALRGRTSYGHQMS